MDYIYTDLLLELEDVEEQLRDLDKHLRNMLWYSNIGDTLDRERWEKKRLLRIELELHREMLASKIYDRFL
jgi:hypothetical protein